MKALAVLAAITAGAAAQGAGQTVDFNRDIRPILADRCFHCHGPDPSHRKADLRLDTEEGAFLSAIVPGKPDESPLLARITATDPNDVMPPPDALKKAVTPEEAAKIRQWIADGAPWAEHWSFAAPEKPAPSAVANADWPLSDIDRFILARIEAEGLAPSPEADKTTLLRRVSFDLTGLPPTVAELDAFLADDSPEAYEKAVDRLLASPHYGERMAMDWLDGARYADTNGYQNDFQRYMWPWRDWVIEAYNANMPFDQFTIEQLAGDLLPNASQSQIVATGFNRNHRANTEGGSIEAEWHVENIVDRVETTSAVWLGLSMGCARCHDHKYDPVSQREFYEFFAFFNTTADRGFYEETRGNAGPQVALYTEETTARVAEFDARIAELTPRVETAKAEADAAFESWRGGLTPDRLPAAEPAPVFNAPFQGDMRIGGTGPFAAGGVAVKSDGEGGWFDSPVGRAIYMDGRIDSGVNLGAPDLFAAGKPFAVSMWVKPERPGTIFSKMDGAPGHRGVEASFTETGVLTVRLVDALPDSAIVAVGERPLRVGEGQWTHLAVSYDGSGKAAGLKVFNAGAPLPMKIEMDALSGDIASSEALWLGRRGKESLSRITVADLRVYDVAVDEAGVNAQIENALAAASGRLSDAQAPLFRAFYEWRSQPGYVALRDSLEAANREKAEYVKAEVPTVMIMEEMAEPRMTYLLQRGVYDQPDTDEALNPSLPAFLPDLPEGAEANRLGLAQWIVAPENPLTARVNVNRLWQKFFGQGLVKTAEDFGLQGDAPSHPELLDWLAIRFIESGWDLKAIQKDIVMSAAYRQASAVARDLLERDPENVLLARGPRFRLPAELIRDNALAVSGLLAERIGGPSVMPYQPDKLWDELAGGAGQGPYVRSEGDDLYRRSLYTYRKRTVPHPTLATFDAPSWEICRVRRTRTNTPLQALALLNDTTYVEAARHLAQRMLLEAEGAPADRLAFGFRVATGRTPNPREIDALASGHDRYLKTYRADPQAAAAFVEEGESPVAEGVDKAELAAYMAAAGVLLNLDETITKE